MSKTQIDWVRNADGSQGRSWQVVTGCTPVSLGCANCYAARMASTRLKSHPRYKGLAVDGRWTGKVRLNRDVKAGALRWTKPSTVFVAPMGDLYHPDVPTAYILEVYETMEMAKEHTFIVVTKRPERIQDVLYGEDGWWYYGGGDYLPNVWHLVSVENQATASLRIPHLLTLGDSGWPVLGVSIEPLLGSIDLSLWLFDLNWIIVGGESGPNARPMNAYAAQWLKDEAEIADVPFFFKQWGEWIHDSEIPFNPRVKLVLESTDLPPQGNPEVFRWNDGTCSYRVGRKVAGKTLGGKTYEEMPKALGGLRNGQVQTQRTDSL